MAAPSEQEFQCSYCDFTARDYKKYYNHKRKHSRIVRACPNCDYTSWFKQPLENHIQAHHEGVVFNCADCGNVYKYPGDLKTHQRSAHEGIVYPCRYCPHKSKRRGELIQHEQFVHTRKKVITCKICDQTFLRNYHLKRHMVRHTEAFPFKCPQCDNVAFRRSHDLACHQRCHDKNPGEIISNRPYVCEECSKTFIMPHHLKEHKGVHSEERPFSCNICEKSFRLKSYLKCHNKIHCRGPSCNQCGQGFSNAKFLEHHIMEKHAVQQCMPTIEQSRISNDKVSQNSELFSNKEEIKIEDQPPQEPMSVEYKQEKK